MSSSAAPREYQSSVEAGKYFGYTNDYVARLAREKKVVGMQKGRQWFVDMRSLEEFIQKTEEARKKQARKVRDERRKERASFGGAVRKPPVPVSGTHVTIPPRATALAKAGLVLSVGVLAGSLFFTIGNGLVGQQKVSSASVIEALRTFASQFYSWESKEVPELSPQVDASSRATAATEAPRSAEEGIVVLSPTETTSLEEVRNSFSDETEVIIDEHGKSGLIKPIFKSGMDTTYRFLMVPLESGEDKP